MLESYIRRMNNATPRRHFVGEHPVNISAEPPGGSQPGRGMSCAAPAAGESSSDVGSQVDDSARFRRGEDAAEGADVDARDAGLFHVIMNA